MQYNTGNDAGKQKRLASEGNPGLCCDGVKKRAAQRLMRCSSDYFATEFQDRVNLLFDSS
jgi:hypothetical protein